MSHFIGLERSNLPLSIHEKISYLFMHDRSFYCDDEFAAEI